MTRGTHRSLLEDLAFFAQETVLAAQAPELLAILAGQALGLAGIDPGLADPVTQGLVADAKVLCGAVDRLAAGARQAHRLKPELGWVGRSCSWHVDSHPEGERPRCSGVHGNRQLQLRPRTVHRSRQPRLHGHRGVGLTRQGGGRPYRAAPLGQQRSIAVTQEGRDDA